MAVGHVRLQLCTYCIVPYVRGRSAAAIPTGFLTRRGDLCGRIPRDYPCSDKTSTPTDATRRTAWTSRAVKQDKRYPGDFLIRFMTSHPKDATKRLFDTIARCEKVARHFHLPFQSGSNRILKAMNRGYTREQYLELIEYARSAIPGISFTSDVIVGFPGETREDFDRTLDLIRRVCFTSLFTFIYSPRKGTPASRLDDPVPMEEKTAWFKEMTDLQEEIAAAHSASMVGKPAAPLSKARRRLLEARLSENIVVRVEGGSDAVGRFAMVEITGARSWILTGRITEIL